MPAGRNISCNLDVLPEKYTFVEDNLSARLFFPEVKIVFQILRKWRFPSPRWEEM